MFCWQAFPLRREPAIGAALMGAVNSSFGDTSLPPDTTTG